LGKNFESKFFVGIFVRIFAGFFECDLLGGRKK